MGCFGGCCGGSSCCGPYYPQHPLCGRFKGPALRINDVTTECNPFCCYLPKPKGKAVNRANLWARGYHQPPNYCPSYVERIISRIDLQSPHRQIPFNPMGPCFCNK